MAELTFSIVKVYVFFSVYRMRLLYHCFVSYTKNTLTRILYHVCASFDQFFPIFLHPGGFVTRMYEFSLSVALFVF